MPTHRRLKDLATLRNQQVARSSRVTSSRKKRLPDLGAFFLSGAPGFATRVKPAPAGGFPLRSDVVGTYGSPTNAPPFPWQLCLRKATDPHPDPQAEITRNDQKSPESRQNQPSGDFSF